MWGQTQGIQSCRIKQFETWKMFWLRGINSTLNLLKTRPDNTKIPVHCYRRNQSDILSVQRAFWSGASGAHRCQTLSRRDILRTCTGHLICLSLAVSPWHCLRLSQSLSGMCSPLSCRQVHKKQYWPTALFPLHFVFELVSLHMMLGQQGTVTSTKLQLGSLFAVLAICWCQAGVLLMLAAVVKWCDTCQAPPVKSYTLSWETASPLLSQMRLEQKYEANHDELCMYRSCSCLKVHGPISQNGFSYSNHA